MKEREGLLLLPIVRLQICAIYACDISYMKTTMLFLFGTEGLSLSLFFSLEENFFLKTHGRFFSRVYLGREMGVD